MKLNFQDVLRDALITVPVTFAATAVVTYLYSLIVHNAGVIDWETAFQLAVIFGIVLPLMRSRSGQAGSQPRQRGGA